jgi:phosphoglycerol transferase MdoB-like AlkP superfamily enzyme
MKNLYPRFNEYAVFLYRLVLAFIFYQISRLLFYLYNRELINVGSVSEYLDLSRHGFTFDTISILYVNALFIILSIIPFTINTSRLYQKWVSFAYFVPNLIAYATNYVDFIYFKYLLNRSTVSTIEAIEHETNKKTLFTHFVVDYWHVTILYLLFVSIWIWLYTKVKVKETHNRKLPYFTVSIIHFLVIGVLFVAGVRGGDLKKSTRPYTIVDANTFANKPSQSHLILNTPFTIMKTIGINTYQKSNQYNQSYIDSVFKPIKQFTPQDSLPKKNIVLFILESFSAEYIGACNLNTEIVDYKSYSPFLDSLAQHSEIYTNVYANGRKSIHAMASVLASIPSFKDSYATSPHVNQETESLVSTLNSMGYDTSFFHGAPNGSMGFQGFANILGYNYYYGMTEYNDDSQHDGYWGIWDEPFFRFMGETLSQKQEPFMSTIFSVSSHEPYVVPEKYKDYFPKGDNPMHQVVGYTDYALKKFMEQVKKESWYNNTIFVFTADHGNLIHYKEYAQELNYNKVPIIIFDPSINQGSIDSDIAQQMDVYPTLLHKIGYDKPFRSWGRTLKDTTSVKPFAVRYQNNGFQYIKEGFVLTLNDQKKMQLFRESDKDFSNDVSHEFPEITQQFKNECSAFVEDYMNKIIDRKLTAKAIIE